VITRPLDKSVGVTTQFHYDPATDEFFIESQEDVKELIDHNKRLYNAHDERTRWKGEWHLAASLPPTVYFDLQRRGILDDTKAWNEWLNNPDNRFFRTRPGRI
jgi:hypothetical protein